MQRNNHNIDFLLKLDILEENINNEVDEDWLEIHLNALIEDIGNIEGVASATSVRFEQVVVIKIRSDLTKNELKDKMKIYLLRELEYFGFISIEIIT